MEKYYRPQESERAQQRFWEETDIYHFAPDREGEIYAIDTPPPTVSGKLHIGHIFSYTQAEIIARYKRMRGYNVFYPFGFDDNGLPTERLVERECGVRAKDLPRGEFIARCRETAQRVEAEFTEMWKSLGFSCDWSLLYRTADPLAQRISQRSFIELARRGRAYMKQSPVLFCTQCQTSIAQAELESRDADSAFIHVPFIAGGEILPVATTRPELLYGCVCLFVHPSDARYAGFIGGEAEVPLYKFRIPILSDELADPEKGTGVVMCATYGDATDVKWAEKYDLPYRKVILPDGRIDGAAPFIAGLPVKAARKRIIALLEENGLLIKSEPITHAVAAHERCGQEVEIIPSGQWYIDVLTDRQRYLDAADGLNWYPPSMKARYVSWVENLKWDWCVSRQRYFGVPIPVWYCKGCGRPVFPREEQLPVNPPETAYEGACACGCTEFIPESAVLDTWATSSMTPFINARWGGAGDRSKKILPMSLRTQAHEIIRTWAFYTVVKSLYHTDSLPWKDLMICGFVLAKKGEKISKSKANAAQSPGELIKEHSADALRYWSAGAKLGTDTFFDPEELSAAKRFMTKLYNASKFSMLHLQDFAPDRPAELLPVDRWILERLKETSRKAAGYLDEYEIGAARHEIDELFFKDFCDDYIEIVKERLYMPEIHGATERRSGQYALYHALLGILKLYAPYVPHITEFIYRGFFAERQGCPSVHLLEWDAADGADGEVLAFGGALRGAIYTARKYKTERNLSMREPMSTLEIAAEKGQLNWFYLTEKDIRACTRAKEIAYRII